MAPPERPKTQDSEPVALRLARHVGIAVFVLVSLVALAFTAAWALATLRARPLDGVEGEIVFEAMRLREKHALYMDPALGDPATGDPPTRYFVLYPPLFSWLVSLAPVSTVAGATALVRAVSIAAWGTAVAVLARRGHLKERGRGRLVLVLGGAAFVLGTYVLSLFGASGRPDALALMFAALGLSRAVSRGKVDALAGVLFALAVFTKPNVLGLASGALLATVLRHRLRAWSGLLGFGGAAAALFLVMHVASGGQLLAHLLASTAQDTSASLWLSQMGSRLPFFLVPIVLGLWLGVRHWKDDHAFVAFLALATSFAWAVLSLAKIGSASNYWMEPCLGALCLLSRAPDLSLGRGTTLAAVLLAVQAPYDGVASIKSSLEGLRDAPEQRAALDRIRASCSDHPGAAILGDEPGVELELQGRVVDTPFQFAHTKNQRIAHAWERSMDSPNVRCVVVQGDLLERVGEDSAVHDRFSVPVKNTLREHFQLEKKDAGFYIYRAR